MIVEMSKFINAVRYSSLMGSYSGRHYTESISALHSIALQLSMRPETLPLYNLRLLPLTIERSAILAQLESEENHAIGCAQIAYNEERERVEEEWRKGRDRVRERLLEGIEERRRRAREDKEGEGTLGGELVTTHKLDSILSRCQMLPWTQHRGLT